MAVEATSRLAAATRSVPGVVMLRTYRPALLGKDLVAGLVLTTLLVPQGMAYAELAGLPAITGLYTTILALIGYALFGPSKALVLGPDSSLGPIIAATDIPLAAADGDPDRRRVRLRAGSDGWCDHCARRRVQTRVRRRPPLEADPDRVHERPRAHDPCQPAAQAVRVLRRGDGLIGEAVAFAEAVGDGETVGAALAIGASCLVLILVLQRLWPIFPSVLAAVVLAIAAVAVFNLEDQGVALVGRAAIRIPAVQHPDRAARDLGMLFAGALAISLVSLTDTISTASAFADKTGTEIDGNREMVGVGAAHRRRVLPGFPVSTSGSRTAVAFQSGARTQVTGLVGAAAIVALLLFAPGLLRNLPQPALAAVVIAASLALADIAGMRRLRRQRRSDFVLALVAFLGVALLGVLQESPSPSACPS